MKKQKELVYETDWDVLVVLDAGRFDYFARTYEDYLDGTLRKVKSVGSMTAEWLEGTFEGDYEDVVYISGHPFVNSKGIEAIDFNAKNHFYRVVDDLGEVR